MHDVVVMLYDWLVDFLEFSKIFVDIAVMPVGDFIFRYAPTGDNFNMFYVAVLHKLGISQLSLVSLLFGVGLLAVIAVSVIKWLIGIFT